MLQTLINEYPIWFYLACGLIGIGIWAFIIETLHMFHDQRKQIHNNDLIDVKKNDCVTSLDNTRQKAFRSDNCSNI